MNNELQPGESEELNRIAGLAAQEKRMLRFNQATWLAWWAGTILIVLSWVQIVSNQVGWIGFAAAMASTFARVIIGRFWKFPR